MRASTSLPKAIAEATPQRYSSPSRDLLPPPIHLENCSQTALAAVQSSEQTAMPVAASASGFCELYSSLLARGLGCASYYDANGNLTQDDLYKYKYDAENRMVEIKLLNNTPGAAPF